MAKKRTTKPKKEIQEPEIVLAVLIPQENTGAYKTKGGNKITLIKKWVLYGVEKPKGLDMVVDNSTRARLIKQKIAKDYIEDTKIK